MAGEDYSDRGARTRRILVGAQVACSLVLLVGAGLLLKSFARLSEVNLGFNPDHVLTARVTLGSERYEDEALQVRFFEELLGRVRSVPGVHAVGAINWLPLSGVGSATRMTIQGEPPTRPGEEPAASVRAVDPDFFAAWRSSSPRAHDSAHRSSGRAPIGGSESALCEPVSCLVGTRWAAAS